LRYDAHWLRQASGVIIAPEALTQPPNDWFTVTYHPLVSFDRLQGITHSLIAWEATPPWVFVPFSAIIARCDIQPSISICFPSSGFRNLSTGNTSATTCKFIPPCRHSWGLTFRDYIPADRISFPTPPTPSPLPTLHGFLSDETHSSPCLTAPALPDHDPFRLTPCRLAATGFHLGLQSTLECYSQPSLLRSTTGFTPLPRQHLSWPFSPSGYCSIIALGRNPPL